MAAPLNDWLAYFARMLGAVVFVLGLLCLAGAFSQAAADCVPIQSLRVIDGDTVEADGVRVRLEGVDSPEVFKPRCLKEDMLGQRATLRLQMLVEASGALSYCPSGVDRYGRTLATLRGSEGDLGGILVREGYARPWRGKTSDWCHD